MLLGQVVSGMPRKEDGLLPCQSTEVRWRTVVFSKRLAEGTPSPASWTKHDETHSQPSSPSRGNTEDLARPMGKDTFSQRSSSAPSSTTNHSFLVTDDGQKHSLTLRRATMVADQFSPLVSVHSLFARSFRRQRRAVKRTPTKKPQAQPMHWPDTAWCHRSVTHHVRKPGHREGVCVCQLVDKGQYQIQVEKNPGSRARSYADE